MKRRKKQAALVSRVDRKLQGNQQLHCVLHTGNRSFSIFPQGSHVEIKFCLKKRKETMDRWAIKVAVKKYTSPARNEMRAE